MDEKTRGALKRIIEEVEQKRKAECEMRKCIVNDQIGGNDIDLVKDWLNEEKYYVVVGDNNFWYATFTAESEEVARNLFADTIGGVLEGRFEADKPERVYLYEGNEIERHNFTK